MFLRPTILSDIERKAKTCSICLNAGENLKFRIPSTKTLNFEPQKSKRGNSNSKPESNKSVKGSAFTSKDWRITESDTTTRQFCTLARDWPKQSSNQRKTKIEDVQSLSKSLYKAFYVLRFTTCSETKKKPFDRHFGQKPGTKLLNLRSTISVFQLTRKTCPSTRIFPEE